MRKSVVVLTSSCVIAAGLLLYGAEAPDEAARERVNVVPQPFERPPGAAEDVAKSEQAQADTAASRRPNPRPVPGQLVLQGTMDTGDPATSRAFIAPNDGASAGSYRIGDRLPDGQILSGIGANTIQVQQAGRMNTVALRDASGQAPVQTGSDDDDEGMLFFDPELEAVATSDAGNELPTYSIDVGRDSVMPANAPARRGQLRSPYFPDGIEQ